MKGGPRGPAPSGSRRPSSVSAGAPGGRKAARGPPRPLYCRTPPGVTRSTGECGGREVRGRCRGGLDGPLSPCRRLSLSPPPASTLSPPGGGCNPGRLGKRGEGGLSSEAHPISSAVLPRRLPGHSLRRGRGQAQGKPEGGRGPEGPPSRPTFRRVARGRSRGIAIPVGPPPLAASRVPLLPCRGKAGGARWAGVPSGASGWGPRSSSAERGYLVDPASSICLSQRLSHACLSTHGRYSETANGSLNQLWFLWSLQPLLG